MNQANSDSTSIFDNIIAKLTPKVLALLIGLGMMLLAVIIGIAVIRGQDVKLFGIEISQPSKACTEDLARCEQTLSQAVRVSEMQEIIGAPLTRAQALDTLRVLLKFAGEAAEWRNNFTYKLFLLEQQMSRYGGFISTRIQDSSRTEAYRMIQSVLSDIGFYEGPLNGDQSATNNALQAFQNDYNQRVPEEARITALGSFGFQTLEAVRSHHRQIPG